MARNEHAVGDSRQLSPLEEMARRAEIMAPVEEQVSGLSLSDLDGVVRAAFERGFRLGANREFNSGTSEQAKVDRERVAKLIEPMKFEVVGALGYVVNDLPKNTPPKRRERIEHAHKNARDVLRDLNRWIETHGAIGRWTEGAR